VNETARATRPVIRSTGLLLLWAAGLSAACSQAAIVTNSPSPVPAASATPSPTVEPTRSLPPKEGTIVSVPVAEDLDHPAAFAVTPEGHMIYGERLTGEIREVDPSTGADRRVALIPHVVGALDNEQGLTGIALGPGYPDSPAVYAYATRDLGAVVRGQILRISTPEGGRPRMKVIFDTGEPAGLRHNGGRLLFGPDGMLYATIGETDMPDRSQDIGSALGKVLRMTPTGKVPDDNPFRSYTFAYGFRNSFGIVFDPRSGDLWETENGPECNDEVNRVVPGGNYGWGPSQDCDEPSPGGTNRDGPDPIPPEVYFEVPIGITGIVACEDCGLRRSEEGALLFGSFNTGQVTALKLSENRIHVVKQEVVLEHGRMVLSMETGPDGRIYLSDGGAVYRLELEP